MAMDIDDAMLPYSGLRPYGMSCCGKMQSEELYETDDDYDLDH